MSDEFSYDPDYSPEVVAAVDLELRRRQYAYDVERARLTHVRAQLQAYEDTQQAIREFQAKVLQAEVRRRLAGAGRNRLLTQDD